MRATINDASTTATPELLDQVGELRGAGKHAEADALQATHFKGHTSVALNAVLRSKASGAAGTAVRATINDASTSATPELLV